MNLAYGVPEQLVSCFKRSALVDIDPGLTQIWISTGQIKVAPHDIYFTIGETVGRPAALFPDCGLKWHHTPPPVFLPAWPVNGANDGAVYSTITSWWEGAWVEFGDESYSNTKRDGFLPFLALPKHLSQSLELAIPEGTGVAEEKQSLVNQGWRIKDSFTTCSTPLNYERYIQNSRGEFSCVKPSYIRLQTAWISDRTICYLASGKPAIVQHTGPSGYLPGSEGIFRFLTFEECVQAFSRVEADYERHCKSARALAEEYFDAEKVARKVLERALG